MQIRLQKFLSEAGVASRRKAEEFIMSGQVLINGKKAKLGDKVDPEIDIIKVYGKIIQPSQEKIYLALNKPKNYVVSKRDPNGRKTVFSLLPENLQTKVWNVGRLDYDTEGLLLFTNDGELTQELSHPKYEHEKEYEVTINQGPTESQLEHLRTGVQIATGLTYPAKITLRHPHPSPSPKGRGKDVGPTVRITIHEGKKRQIRRMFTGVGLEVKSLKRIRINKLKLANIPSGQYILVNKEDIL